ncbi:45705_t:CDS:2 [Gigaspora margarita]|uniref:45705_t:CDS:1 n=1 Tax=Gigaspora margarita TaxID=4874 RepID=A0ABN7VB65_GIGMA|nr:45705_t:CDS:2 [Gigaspora margarita]
MPLFDCNKIINSVVFEQRFSELSSQSSGTSALADILGNDLKLGFLIAISLLLDQKDPLLYESRTQKKCIIESLYKSDKRQKSTTKKDESSTLFENSYTYLYKEIVQAKANNNITSQKLLNCYLQFVDKEVKNQLPKEINETTYWKQTKRAKKIYELFIETSIDKMEWVKSYSALTIFKLSWESIDYIVNNIKL